MHKIFGSYFGGKSGNGTYQTIINHIPPHKTFLSLFAGHGGIERRIKRAPEFFVNDLDADIVAKWKKAAIPGVTVKNKSAFDLLPYFMHLKKTFIYADPPYLQETRSSNKRYKFELTLTDHLQLLTMANEATCNFMISHYPCELYDSLLEGWNKVCFESMTRGGMRTECIYFNYEVPTVLHDYSFVGNNNTERQRIKRKITRFTKKLQELPAVERNAIIAGLSDQMQLKPSVLQALYPEDKNNFTGT